MTNYLIFGASRGLGAALAAGLPSPGDTLWEVSRTRPPDLERQDGISRHWIAADLAQPAAATLLGELIGTEPIDVLLYNAGIWENSGFSSSYDFEAVEPAENHRILTVNLTAAMDSIQRLLPNLRQAANGKIILIGSTSGLENVRAREVAYNASKFGLRGLAHALRENLRPDFIGVTVINPGTINTSVPYAASVSEAAAVDQEGIPLPDLVNLVRSIIALSRYTCVKEIDLPAMLDPHV